MIRTSTLAKTVIPLSIRSTGDSRAAMERRTAMTWAQQLKRVFSGEIEMCNECGGVVKMIVRI